MFYSRTQLLPQQLSFSTTHPLVCENLPNTWILFNISLFYFTIFHSISLILQFWMKRQGASHILGDFFFSLLSGQWCPWKFYLELYVAIIRYHGVVNGTNTEACMMGLPHDGMVIVVKNPPGNAGDARDVGLISGLGRSPGVGNSNPLQYFPSQASTVCEPWTSKCSSWI